MQRFAGRGPNFGYTGLCVMGEERGEGQVRVIHCTNIGLSQTQQPLLCRWVFVNQECNVLAAEDKECFHTWQIYASRTHPLLWKGRGNWKNLPSVKVTMATSTELQTYGETLRRNNGLGGTMSVPTPHLGHPN